MHAYANFDFCALLLVHARKYLILDANSLLSPVESAVQQKELTARFSLRSVCACKPKIN